MKIFAELFIRERQNGPLVVVSSDPSVTVGDFEPRCLLLMMNKRGQHYSATRKDFVTMRQLEFVVPSIHESAKRMLPEEEEGRFSCIVVINFDGCVVLQPLKIADTNFVPIPRSEAIQRQVQLMRSLSL